MALTCAIYTHQTFRVESKWKEHVRLVKILPYLLSWQPQKLGRTTSTYIMDKHHIRQWDWTYSHRADVWNKTSCLRQRNVESVIQHAEEDAAAKLEVACAKMKQKAAARERRWKRGNANWTSTVLTNTTLPAITQSSLCSDQWYGPDKLRTLHNILGTV
jgi:hypothetical protein